MATKSDMVNYVHDKLDGLTKEQVKNVIDSSLEFVTDNVTDGEEVSLIGFGKFERRQRKGRSGVVPATGEKIQIPPAFYPAFAASKGFKDALKELDVKEE